MLNYGQPLKMFYTDDIGNPVRLQIYYDDSNSIKSQYGSRPSTTGTGASRESVFNDTGTSGRKSHQRDSTTRNTLTR